MLYTMLRPLRVYRGSKCPLPKGEKMGFGNVVFLASPSKQDGEVICEDTFLDYKTSFYKRYYVDFIYRNRIGIKRVLQNKTQEFIRDFDKVNFNGTVLQVRNNNKTRLLKKSPNLIVNLGHWLELYFQYSKKNLPMMKQCEGFITFLASKLNESIYDNYEERILYLDMNQWIYEKGNTFGLTRKFLNNPLSIILVTIYREPELLARLGKITIIIGDRKGKEIFRFSNEDFNQRKFAQLKLKILSMRSISEQLGDIDVESSNADDDTALEEKTIQQQESKNIILSKLKKNLLGNSTSSDEPEDDDVTGETMYDFEDDDFEDDISDDIIEDIEIPEVDDSLEISSLKNEEIDEIMSEMSDYLDENEDLLNIDHDDAADIVRNVVKKKFFLTEFSPKKTVEQEQNIAKLKVAQEEILKQPLANLKSKKLDKVSFEEVVKTSNPNIVESSFINFDKNYNEKKLKSDIDGCLSGLSKAQYPIFITGKEVEDASDSLNLKETHRYTFTDEDGKEMKVSIDIPIIIDDNYIYINGSKKEIGHQLVLKPIVKTKKDLVKIITSYNKIIMLRKGEDDFKTAALLKLLITNQKEYDVRAGNAIPLNKELRTSLEFDIIAKKIYSFRIEDIVFFTDIKDSMNSLKQKGIKVTLSNKILPIGFDTASNKVIYLDLDTENYTEKVLSYLPVDDMHKISRISSKISSSRLMYSTIKMQNKDIPTILFVLFCDGFKNVMEKAGIQWEFINTDKLKGIDLTKYGYTKLQDGYIIWERYPLKNSLLMNGLSKLPMDIFNFEELESKDTYINLLSQYYTSSNIAMYLDQYKDFLLSDIITYEIVKDHGLPTDVVEFILYANSLFANNDFLLETDYNNMRLRSNEIIPVYAYKAITNEYFKYRKTKHKPNASKLNIKQSIVIDALVSGNVKEIPSSNQLINNKAVLNPILEISRKHSVTYKGDSGIGEHGMTLNKRAYNPSMVGITGITSSPDGNIGVTRMLTLEPNITSTRGYINVSEDSDDLTAPNVFTPAELLTPMGVQHDDPARTAMAYKQAMYMLPVEDSDPVLIGNGVEKILPYHMSEEFCVIAKDDGEVVDKVDDLVVIKYKNGKFHTLDLSVRISNTTTGFNINNQLTSDLKVGDKVSKSQVVAWYPKAFTKNSDDLSASMNMGPLLKFAVIPEWDIYEDSAPITANASKKATTYMSMPTEITLNKNSYVYKMAKVGDYVNTGDVLIQFDQAHEDEDARAFFENLRELDDTGDMLNNIIEDASTTIQSTYTGRIIDIEIVNACEIDELSDTLKKIVVDYNKKLKKKIDVLDKYSNPGDLKYYKSGQLITKVPEKVKLNYQGKARGHNLEDSVLIIFHIEFKDTMGKGDKLSAEFALKSITSHVIEEGLEAYSQHRPEENIDLITAPLSISARKTGAIFRAMAGNKALIEAKRIMQEFWESN